MLPNLNVCDFAAYKRRHDAAARCAPLDHSGRRDPDGRPAFDPDARALRAAREHLAQVLTDPTTPPAVRDSLAVVLDAQEDAA